MKIAALVIFIFLVHKYSYAQKESWTVISGEHAQYILPDSVKFVYPQFTAGIVYFKNQTTSQASLNYNLLNGEMEFISPKGDTLSLADEVTIKYITINKDSFYYDKGYLELIIGNPVIKLAKREALKTGDTKKAGGYDQSSSISAITTVRSVRLNNSVTSLSEKKEVELVKETSYYFGDAYNHFLPANKKNLMKLFGKKEAQLETYLKDRKIRFNNEADLKNLVSFLSEK